MKHFNPLCVQMMLIYWANNKNTTRENTEALLEGSSKVDLEEIAGKLRIWLCLATKVRDIIIIY
jgi:hypothetical protein